MPLGPAGGTEGPRAESPLSGGRGIEVLRERRRPALTGGCPPLGGVKPPGMVQGSVGRAVGRARAEPAAVEAPRLSDFRLFFGVASPTRGRFHHRSLPLAARRMARALFFLPCFVLRLYAPVCPASSP